MTDIDLAAIEDRARLELSRVEERPRPNSRLYWLLETGIPALIARVRELEADLADADNFNKLAYGDVRQAATLAERERCLDIVAAAEHAFGVCEATIKIYREIRAAAPACPRCGEPIVYPTDHANVGGEDVHCRCLK